MMNKTMLTEFILVGFTGGPLFQISLFIILLVIYTVTLVGNAAMIVIICTHQQLHTPMYLFLWNLSLLETLNISNVVPLMLVQIYLMHMSVSLIYCFIQCFSYFYFVTMSFLLLAVMSFDRYVAICSPLRYPAIMSRRLCIQLVIASWLGPSIFIFIPALLMTRLPFCSHIINHFFCDSLAIIELACTDTRLLQLIIAVLAFIVVPGSLGLTAASYAFIISVVLKIPSTDGRQRVFSTCSSHLAMVTIVYGSAIFIEASPAFNPSVEVYKTVHMISTIISPLMNPFVYTLRNGPVKKVLKKCIQQVSQHQSCKITLPAG